MRLLKLLCTFVVFNIAPQASKPGLNEVIGNFGSFVDTQSLGQLAQVNSKICMTTKTRLNQILEETITAKHSMHAEKRGSYYYESHDVIFDIFGVEYEWHLWINNPKLRENFRNALELNEDEHVPKIVSFKQISALLKLENYGAPEKCPKFRMKIYPEWNELGLEVELYEFRPNTTGTNFNLIVLFHQLYKFKQKIMNFHDKDLFKPGYIGEYSNWFKEIVKEAECKEVSLIPLCHWPT